MMALPTYEYKTALKKWRDVLASETDLRKRAEKLLEQGIILLGDGSVAFDPILTSEALGEAEKADAKDLQAEAYKRIGMFWGKIPSLISSVMFRHHIHIILLTLQLFFFASSINAFASVTPQQFGAKADGIHDDTKAIQEAINQRGKVVFPEGTYLISSKLIVYSGTYLLGRKNATIKQTKDTFILFNEHAQSSCGIIDNGITIDGLTLDGIAVNAKSEYAAGIYFCGVSNATVKNCRLIDIGGDGIYLGRGGKDSYCKNVRINNCTFTNCGRNSANPRQSIAVVFAENVNITNCAMNNTRKTSYAVDIEPNKADEHCSVVVSGCRMIGCGISSGGHKSAKKSIQVNKCHIDCSGTDNATLAAVRTAAKITGNTIISNGKQNGITVATSPSAIVKKNNIRDASAGVLITDGADNVVIKGNTIENCSSGVYVMKSRGLAILSNILRTKGKGIYVRMESGGTRVENNKIRTESGQDVYSKETEDVRVRRNIKLQ